MAKKVRTKVKEVELDEFTQFLIEMQSALNRRKGDRNSTGSGALNHANKISIQENKGDQNYGK